MKAAARTNGEALRFAREGARIQRAIRLLERESGRVANAIRYGVPFLARRQIRVTHEVPGAAAFSEIVGAVERPSYVARVEVRPGGRGAIVLDAKAIGTFLDGMLGGDGSTPPTLKPEGLSSAQLVLVARIADGIVRIVGEALQSKAGLSFRREQAATTNESEFREDDVSIVARFEIFAEDVSLGRVSVVLPRGIDTGASGEHPVTKHLPEVLDQRVLATVANVEIEVVVELARMSIDVGTLAALRVGSTLRLDVQIGEPVTIRVQGRPLFAAFPTTAGDHIALRIASPATPTTSSGVHLRGSSEEKP